MDEASITQSIADTFTGVDVVVASREAGSPEAAWGDTFFFYEPDHRFPFATIVTKDYADFDCASNLDRPKVFRLNIGVSRETYRLLFGTQEPSPDTNGAVETSYDFTVLDQLMPHPVYAKMNWICVLNPSATTVQQTVWPLLAGAYDLAVSKYAKRETHG